MGSTIWLAILGSAAIGALVSAAITFIGQALERRARREELLLSKAIEVAFKNTDFAEKRNLPIQDDVMQAAMYYRELKHLIEKGDVSAEAKASEKSSLDRLEAEAADKQAQRDASKRGK